LSLKLSSLQQNISKKISQSYYFLEQMKQLEREGDGKDFYYVYSAFLSSSRSALLFIEKHRRNFYKRNIKDVTLKTKFQNERNIDIHEEPISITNRGESFMIGTLTVVREDEPKENLSIQTNERNQGFPRINEYKIYFADEHHFIDENRIVVLAEKYLNEIVDLQAKLIR